MDNRMKRIKEKGFRMETSNSAPNYEYDENGLIDFAKIKVGLKFLDDAIVDIGMIKKANPVIADKKTILNAIDRGNLKEMRATSRFFFSISGIYSRLCRYLANLYRYDWMVTPYIYDKEEKSKTTALISYEKVLSFLDNFQVKRFFEDAALKVILDGAYYGYIVDNGDGLKVIQELPVAYCRSRYKSNGRPVVEFNMKFFDEVYRDINQRMRVIKAFPLEFAKGYVAYKEGKLAPDFQGDQLGWYMLDPELAFKFNLYENDYPTLISVIPAILDLDAAQELDRKKMLQQLLKIIIQKMPLDKNGDLVFDVDEARELHNNAVSMLGKAVGVDVLTTFADVQVADMADRNTVSSIDQLEKVERTVYNESGTAQNLFNTNGNVALDRSILNDEASIHNLVLQFEDFLNVLISSFNSSPKKFSFRVQILPTTVYNYKELSKQYKELTQLGYSKMLPLIALGQTQSSILATAYFENEVLNLAEMLVPPMSSNTMSSKALDDKKSSKEGNKTSEDNKGGREEKPDNEKSDKTIANRESMS